MTNIIKKITIEIGGTEVSVTPEEARNLYEALKQLMGEKSTTPVWYWPWSQPYWYGNITVSGQPITDSDGNIAVTSGTMNYTDNTVKITI